MPLPPQVSPPQFALIDVAPSRLVGVGVVAVPVLPGEDGVTLGPGAAELAEDLGVDLLEVLASAGATGVTGEVTELPVIRIADVPNPALTRVLMVGVGEATTTDLRRAGATVARRTTNADAVASSIAAVGGDDAMAAFVEGATLGSFSFSMHRDGPRDRPVGKVVLCLYGDDEDRQTRLRRTVAAAGASWSARLLASVPSNIKTPASRQRSWTRSSWPSAASVASSASAKQPLLLPASCSSSTSPPPSRPRSPDGVPAKLLTWCSSARASPSTAVACPSSPVRPW